MLTADLFFKELQRLVDARPKFPTQVLNSTDSEWGNNLYFCQNMHWSFESIRCKNCAYVYNCMACISSIDCDYSFESELCYESVDAIKSYNCAFLENCSNMRDSYYCTKSNNCQNCFGCTQLRNKSFCLFNRQLSEQEYRQQVEKYKNLPSQTVLQMVKDLGGRYPVTQTNENFNENASYGNYIYYNKNCYLCFDARNCQNCAYVYDSGDQKTCFDINLCEPSELVYEATDSARLFDCNYIVWSADLTNCDYCLDCANLKNCLGCSGFINKSYCILNRQFSKEEYERIRGPLLTEIQAQNLGWQNLTY